MKVLYHLISGQSLQNYIAARHISPDRNVYIYTEDSKKNIDLLSSVIKEPHEILKVDAWNYTEIRNKLSTFLSKRQNEESILNFTGGTKAMAVASFEVFREMHKKCIYINSQDETMLIYDFSSDAMNMENRSFEIKGNLDEYIQLNGQTLSSPLFHETPVQESCRHFLESRFDIYSRDILGFARKNDIKKNNNVIIPFEASSDSRRAGTVFKEERGKSIVRFCFDGKKEFEAEEDGNELLEFLRGRWFEIACYKKLCSAGFFDEIRMNAIIKRQDNGQFVEKNEIDLLAIKGMYPHLFECKSGGVPSDTVEKLSALKNTYMGRYSSIYLITYFPLNKADQKQQLIMEKLGDSKVTLLHFNELENYFTIRRLDKVNLK